MTLIKQLSLLGLLSLPLLAHAKEVTITNDSDEYGSIMFNEICSAEDGEAGILQPHQVYTIPPHIYKYACKNWGCKA